MKTLIITAHPSSLGFTHKIASAYKAGAESVGCEVEVVDLYRETSKQGYLLFENIKDPSIDALRDIYQKKISEANNIVFVHPLWWGSMPAILKNFIDCNFTPRFAYRYINGRPVGLLKGRTASVYITCDGSIGIYRLLAFPFKITWRFIILGTCGLKVNNISILDKKFKRTEGELNIFLEMVNGDARKLKQ
jgi:putative NADPH-quinone reductase